MLLFPLIKAYVYLENVEPGEDILQADSMMNNSSVNGEVQDPVTPMDADLTEGKSSFHFSQLIEQRFLGT